MTLKGLLRSVIQVADTGIHFSIIRNVDYFYTSKFNWMPVSGHWNNKKRAGPSLYIRYRLSYDRDKRDRLRSRTFSQNHSLGRDCIHDVGLIIQCYFAFLS